MGLFDKEKLKNIAIKTKDGIISTIEEAEQERQRKKELGLLDDVKISKLEYKGGHPALPKEKDCTLEVTNDNLKISYGLTNEAIIEFSNISGVRFETMEQISSRVTVTRLALLGVFAFALKKKKKDSEKYLTIDFCENGLENTVVIAGKNAQLAHSKIYERYSCFLQRNPQTENKEQITTSFDPYEEVKKAKELLDMGIISQEEFNKKKEELLKL